MLANGCTNTLQSSGQPVRFGVVADIQYAEKPEAMGRYYADSREGLKRCVADLSEKKPAFVIQLGDLIDGGANAEQELREIVRIYRQLPMAGYHTLGNHDFGGLDRASVLQTLGMEKSYYTFDAGAWRFVVLDTQDMAIQGGWGENSDRYLASLAMMEALKAAGAENAVEYGGGIGTEQQRWLAEILTQADAEGKRVIVCGHLPLMPLGDRHTAWNAREIVAALEAHPCVKAYFCGHQHGGGYRYVNGIHYVTFEAMVDAARNGGAWAVVTLSPENIAIDGLGAVTSRTLKIDNDR